MAGDRDSAAFPAAKGFTLVELVVVLITLGVLAVAIVPRFANRTDFDARGFLDDTLSILRYAQKSAVAQRRQVCVTFGANPAATLTIASTFGGACDTNLAGPDGSSPYTIPARTGVAYSATPSNFSFLPSGAASLSQTINVAGVTSTSITVFAATGYVQQN